MTTGDPPLEPGLFSGDWWTTAPALQWLHEGHWGRRGTKKWTATETKEVEHLGSKAWTVKNGDKRASTPFHDWTLGKCHDVARASTAFLTVSMRKPMIIHRNWGYTAVWSFDSHNSNGKKVIFSDLVVNGNLWFYLRDHFNSWVYVQEVLWFSELEEHTKAIWGCITPKTCNRLGGHPELSTTRRCELEGTMALTHKCWTMIVGFCFLLF